jgi:GT2 family glycosyltransferase
MSRRAVENDVEFLPTVALRHALEEGQEVPAGMPRATGADDAPRRHLQGRGQPRQRGVCVFAADHEVADCAAIIVTYNSAADIGGLLDSLPAAAGGLRVRVVVVDNDSSDDIASVVARYPGVLFVPAGRNLGYAGGLNVGRPYCRQTRSVIVLNPDLVLGPGSILALFAALSRPGTGAAVPRMLAEDGQLFPSLRREPSLTRAVGDALFGKTWPKRPGWLSEMVWSREPYKREGTVQWATGAMLIISAEADAAVGAWDDVQFFLYSEETDYCRRLREAGYTIHYVPDAIVVHRGGGSGISPDLVALNEVNRIRYFRKYHGWLASTVFRAAVILTELLRVHRPGNRRALWALLSARRWSRLPGRRT